MSDYIINDEWIHSFMVSIEELIGESIEYEGYQNPVPPLREIVRCRDCERYRDHMWITVPEFEPFGTDIDDVCTFFAGGVKVSPDGFCAWGERKGEDE